MSGPRGRAGGRFAAERLRHGAALLALVFMAAAGACVPRGAAQEPEPTLPALPAEETAQPLSGGTLRYAIQEPSAIVPPLATEPSDLVIVDALFDSLTTYKRDLSVEESAAVDWVSNSDATVWRFDLRPDATFHDGSPVTAEDFKFSWEEAVHTDLAGYHLWMVEGWDELRRGAADGLSGVVAVDDLLLEVRLSTPYADFPAVVAHPALGPVHRATWGTGIHLVQPIGNGPFQTSEAWAKGRFVRVARFEDWRNGDRGAPAPLREVLFRMHDVETGYLAFQQERVEFATLPAGALRSARELYDASSDGYHGPGVLTGDTPVLYYLGYDVTRPPFDDPEVRRAVSKAIDREAIAEANLDANLRVARSAVPRGVRGAAPPACAACTLLADEAAQVFAEREITELELWFNSGGGHEAIAESIRADLERAGVTLNLREAPFPQFLSRLRSGQLRMFRFGWVLDYPIADNVLYPLLHSGSEGELGANYGGYHSEEVDALLDQARATVPDYDGDDDPDVRERLREHAARERRRLQAEAEQIAIGRDMAIAPIVTLRHSAVVSERVENFYYSPFGLPNLAEVRLLPPRQEVD